MPNWCSNTLQIRGTEEQIASIKQKLDEKEGKNFFDIFVPNADDAGQGDGEKWYQYNLEKYGCKWNCDAFDYSVDSEGTNLTINFDSPWAPPIALYDTLYNELDLGVLAYYDECGMAFCGRYEDGDDFYYEYSDMSADEIEDEIPDDINEMFSISERQHEWEVENGMDEISQHVAYEAAMKGIYEEE